MSQSPQPCLDPGSADDLRRERALLRALAVTLVTVVVTGAAVEPLALSALLAVVSVAYWAEAARRWRQRRIGPTLPLVITNVALVVVLTGVSLLYQLAAAAGGTGPVVHSVLDRHIPLLPAFAVFYVSFRFFVVFTVATVALRGLHHQLRTLLVALVVAIGAAAAEAASFPTTVATPHPAGGGVGPALLRFAATHDAYHRLPSVVAAVAVVCMFAWARVRIPRWRSLAMGWSGAIVVSAALTGQQSVVGVMAGVTLAVCACWIARFALERRPRRVAGEDPGEQRPSERPHLVLLRSS